MYRVITIIDFHTMVNPNETNGSERSQRFSQEILGALRSHGLRVRKADNLFHLDRASQGSLLVTMTLCPLYAAGALRESQLLRPPTEIAQSRVAVKWERQMDALGAVTSVAYKVGRPIEAILTFADVGVIAKDPGEEDPEVLQHHEDLYRTSAEEAFGDRIRIWFQRYSELDPSFPRFISDQTRKLSFRKDDETISSSALMRENPRLRSQIDQLASRLVESGIVFDPSVLDATGHELTAKAQAYVLSLIRQLSGSFEIAEGLIKQYGTFDAQTTAPNALNIFIERETAALLLQLTDLFPHKHHPRIDILC